MEINGFLTLFFMFDIEMVIFACLNIWQPESDHWLLSLSFGVSIFYLAVMIISIPLVFYIVNKPTNILKHEIYIKNYQIVYDGLKLNDKYSKYFKAISITRFLIFGIILVFAYYTPFVQVGCSLLVSIIYYILLFIIQPYEEIYDFILEIITETHLIIVNILFMFLVIDDRFMIFDIDKREMVGWAIFIIILSALIFSVLFLTIEIVKATKEIYEICIKKKNVDRVYTNDNIQSIQEETQTKKEEIKILNPIISKEHQYKKSIDNIQSIESIANENSLIQQSQNSNKDENSKVLVKECKNSFEDNTSLKRLDLNIQNEKQLKKEQEKFKLKIIGESGLDEYIKSSLSEN